MSPPGPKPTLADRARFLERLGDRAAHDAIATDLSCLHEPDVGGRPAEPATGWPRVAAWNLERGRDPAAVAALLRAAGADVALLTEVDRGMARTGNRDVVEDIAAELGMSWAYGVEFVELGFGNRAETQASRGMHNEMGLHGNAILARARLREPAVVRLDAGGEWFTTTSPEPRIGGRMAVVATIALDGTDVTLASVHLESSSDAAHRASQFSPLLDAIDARGTGPAIVGGDLNTFGATYAELGDRATVRRMRDAEPARFSWPVAHEPLFAAAASRGYDWLDANIAGPTTRHGPDGSPHHVPLKIDWILVRGLDASRPTVVPALATVGEALSDHDMVAVSVRLAQ